MIELPALADRDYVVEASAKGYPPVRKAIAQENPMLYKGEITLSKTIVSEPVFSREQLASKGNAPLPLSYRVQIEAVDILDTDAPNYAVPRQFGTIKYELIQDRGLYRIMVGDFSDKSYANDVARELRTSGLFPQAYVVRYRGEERM